MRQPAKELGADLYQSLVSHASVSRVIAPARPWSTRKVPSVLEFPALSELLRVLFELMTSENDFLCFESIITRRLTIDDIPASKTRPFYALIDHLLETISH